MFDTRLKIYVPQRLWEEFLNHKEEILTKSGLFEEDFLVLSSLLFERITFVQLEEYKKYLLKARQLLGSHKKDEDFIALCLLKHCKLWTYETRLFKIGFGISTKEISHKIS